MTFKTTSIPGIVIIEPKVFGDSRGFFLESFHKERFAQHGITEDFVQDNVSRSSKGTLRGLHYQLDPNAQGKLVRVSVGEVYDVAVDIRKGSPTYGKYFGMILSEENKAMMYVPAGFAHGFIVLSETAEFTYKCTNYYAPQSEKSLLWNDPEIGIEWPMQPDLNLISGKDKAASFLKDADINYIWKA
ncbi:MAG: dTDP-4-dehydrorhamnose 3,5-epimerase [Bacteroidetes bacterium]|nr:dTDP-4-dehydrorhamnose 3,5-epimerase [Bacteroidota bacterium]